MNADYETLELKNGASLDEIKTAYHKLTEAWSPDNFSYSPRLQAVAEETLTKINQAYERLCNQKNSEIESKEGSFTKLVVPNETTDDLFPTRPVSEWVGERFIFLQQTKGFHKYGYTSVRTTKDRLGSELAYHQFVGKTAKVTKLVHSSLKVDYELWDMELVVEDTGKKVYADVSSGVVENIALVADIENARALYMDKTLWTKETVNTYNEATGEESYLDTPLGYFPVRVVDVVAGFDTEKPIRFIVRIPSGKEGYLDVHMSDTNIAESLRKYDKFEDILFTEYPTSSEE